MAKHLFRYLDLVGSGLGPNNFIGDYSPTVVKARIDPPEGEIYQLERMIISIEDTNGFTAENYGDLLLQITGDDNPSPGLLPVTFCLIN